MTKLYLDTEFNGHGGELISLALAADDNNGHWYGILPLPEYIVPWVAEHVIPRLERTPNVYVSYVGNARGPEPFRKSLHDYLLRHPNAEIYADWPHDFAHLMNQCAGPSYDLALNYQCTMHLIQTPPGEPRPEVPHNALSDAIALMQWHRSIR